MKLSFTTLDVFTSTRYTGNPLAIIQVPSPLSPSLTQAQKQSIATEFNLSETVFLHLPSPEEPHPTSLKIDIFTSLAEIPFAGHPTIGTASYLLSQTQTETITHLITKAGPIPISKGTRGEVCAEIPHDFHIHSKKYSCPLTDEQQHPVVSIVNGMSFIYVALPSLTTLSQSSSNLHSNTYDPSILDDGWRNGLIGTMYYVLTGIDEQGRKKYRTRMFGSREDPGTGSASSGLACYLSGLEEGKGKGPFRYVFEQGVEMGRRNIIVVEVLRKENGEGVEKVEKVELSGEAVVVMEGTLEVWGS